MALTSGQVDPVQVATLAEVRTPPQGAVLLATVSTGASAPLPSAYQVWQVGTAVVRTSTYPAGHGPGV